MKNYYDRNGKEITVLEYNQLFGEDDYKVIKRSNIDGYLVSTVWLGLDMNHSRDGKPIIFETMVFESDSLERCTDYQERYETEEQAREGHEIAILFVKSKTNKKKVGNNGNVRGRSTGK